MTCASVQRRRLPVTCRTLALAAALGATGSLAHATDYDEATGGDLSGNPAAPTNMGALTSGANRISGTTIPSGTFDPNTHSYSVLDNDYVSFTVPTGFALADIVFMTDSIIQSTDRLFLGIAKGAAVAVDPSFSSAAGLLGWTLVGASMAGTNVLPDLGLSAPANFPAIGGATGFSGALPSGQYTMWILDGDSPASYDFRLDLVPAVPAVPEPGSWAMLLAGVAVTGFALRRRERRTP